MTTALTDNSNAMFSISLDHRWRSDFLEVSDAGTDCASGLSQFFGDSVNGLLRYLTTDDFLDQFSEDAIPGLMPIVFYGPSGTGKTSLAMAVVSKLLSVTESDDSPIFLSGADFARRFYGAIDTDSVEEFREKFADAPAIILDNLQQLVGKLPAQNELASLIDNCSKTGKPILLTCPRLPSTIDGISSPLASRISFGLTLPVHPPGALARQEIIKELSNVHGLQFAEDAVELLSDRFEVTVPKLEHLFKQIRLKFEVEGQPSVIDAALLLSLLQPGEEDQLKMIRVIQKQVAKEFNLKLSDLKSSSRKQTVVLARGIGIFLTRTLLGTSFVKIGQAFGNRDHSTVLHSHQKISSLYQEEGGSSNATTIMINRLKQQLTDQFAALIYQT